MSSFQFANEFAEKIFKLRYAFDENETWEQACRRVAEHIARAEDGPKFAKYSDEFYSELSEGRFMPGGRIWYGAGRNKAQLLNCLAGETEVLTSNGYIKIADLVDTTQTVVDGNGVWSEASFKGYGFQQLFKITLSKGQSRKVIFATANHRWLYHNGGETITANLGCEDILQSVYPKGVRETCGVELCPFGIAQGIIFGDGSTPSAPGRISANIRLCGNKNALLEKYFPLSVKRDIEGDIFIGGLPKHWKYAPPMNSSKSFLYGWLAGYFAADGCVDERGVAVLTSTNLANLEIARNVCGILGIPTSPIRYQDRVSNLTNKESRLYILGIKASELTNDFFLIDEHKKRRINHTKIRTDNWKVVSVEATDRVEYVYCAEVSTTHSFVLSEGLLTGNCFVLGGTPDDDSREGWGKLLSDALIISGTGGGIGINFSEIRPRGTLIAGTGGTATGAVSLMRIVNAVCEEIKAGGNRRSALMFCLNHDHPDIVEFLDAKLDLGQINNANISVVFMNESPEDFFEKVRNGDNHDLTWKGKVVQTIKARDLWDKLVSNALKNGEPGILNFHLANKMNNILYTRKLVSTNPCGEIALSTNGNCCLGALVLPRFVNNSKSKNLRDRVDWEMLHTSVSRGVRFLDDVLTVNHYPIPETEAESKAIRRLGLGIMGLHDMLLKLGLKYSSEEGRDFVDKIMTFIKHASYDTSTYLALEKGPFPEFDAEKVFDNGFVNTLKPSIRNKIRDYGLRNCAILTIAPTGTTSIVQGVTSGIEPIFAAAYNRRFRNDSDRIDSEIVVHPLFEQFVKSDGDVSHFENSDEISPNDHFAMQAICQKHVDNAISKTVNIPQDRYTDAMLSDLYMKYVPHLKGTTIYPVGSRKDTPLEPIPTQAALALVLANKVVSEQESIDTCVSGTCGL